MRVLTFVAYTVIAEYRAGRTLGKRLMGIQVVRESGARISLGQSVLRQLPFFGQFFFIDALFALFTERRQRAFELLTKTRAIALLICIGMLTPAVSAAQANGTDVGAPLGRLVDIGGRKLHLHCIGAGSPTVVLESGASAFAVDWALVQPEVAKTNRVCSYDRAGMGWSDAGEPERADRVVRDLHRFWMPRARSHRMCWWGLRAVASTRGSTSADIRRKWSGWYRSIPAMRADCSRW